MEISTLRLLLKEVSSDDISFIHTLNSLPEVDQYNTLGIPENIEVTNTLVSEIIVAQTVIPRVRYVFVIVDQISNDCMGVCGLVMGKPNYRNAEIWYKLHPNYWGKGFASEAVQALLDVGFNTFQLHRIEAGCATENIASIRVLEKSGFILEAHTRKLLPIRGEWVDNFGYSILEEEFAARLK